MSTLVPAPVQRAHLQRVEVSISSTTSTMVPEEGALTPDSEHKANVAADESLRDSSMSTETLQAMCFESNTSVTTHSSHNCNASTTSSASVPVPATTALKIHVPQALSEAVPVSSASSTCTRESDAFSDADNHSPAPHRLYRQVSEKLNAKVCHRKTSRQGRAGQRTCVTKNNESIRLVTGAVPILKGGKVMFVSSRKKPEWIIPKGGWENDEAMEESAIREVFEEAGVLGVLGPRLSEVQYETRKARKRRLEMETIEQVAKRSGSEQSSPSSSSSLEEKAAPTETTTTTLLSSQDMDRIREHAEATREKHQLDDKASVASASHSQVRMMLYPLYVQKVFDDWPESGRFRKAVDIDTAIEMLDSRPELQAVLKEVKERGLHQIQASEL